jgi:hypothetical protein
MYSLGCVSDLGGKNFVRRKEKVQERKGEFFNLLWEKINSHKNYSW